MMSKSTDERGRLYLPTAVRERYGDRYRIVELPSHVALIPVDEDPVAGIREAVGDAFADVDSESDAVDAAVRAAVARDAELERD
jgi:bifunctional DNA-binding transcriptional regulator/antitoxin component of YhaV-PrlF toxin-antitoxin module